MGGINLPVLPGQRIDQSLSRIRLIPTIPFERSKPFITREQQVETREEFNEWRLKWSGTFPEFLIFRELVRADLEPGVDFEFQSSQLGGRQEIGGAVVDFVLMTRIAGRVQGEFFHFRNIETRIATLIQRIQLEQEGFVVVDMLATEIERIPRKVARLFISGQETPDAQIRGRRT